MAEHVLKRQLLIKQEEIAQGVFLLEFERSFDFLAGQVIGIGIDPDGPRRLYSICSGEQEPVIRILYTVVDDGYLTPLLSKLSAGANIWITTPRGEFVYTPEPAMWIATGTGIAPFYAMLRSGKIAGKTLIHGERIPERFYFSSAFSKQLGEQYIRCCSGECAEGVFSGRVTEYLETASLPPGIKYYLCGRAEMVVETRDLLIARGIPYQNIFSEIYF